jgi:hypothetical protein
MQKMFTVSQQPTTATDHATEESSSGRHILFTEDLF